MPGILSTSGLSTGLNIAPNAAKDPKKTHEAAVQFEALLVGQILKSSHDEDGGWLGTGDDQTAGSAMQMADEYLARSLSANGGLGLAKMITKGLDQAAAAANSSNPST